MMARTKSDPMKSPSRKTSPRPSTSTSTATSSQTTSSQATSSQATSSQATSSQATSSQATSSHKRRLDYDALVESGSNESKHDELDSQKSKRMKTRSASKLESDSQTSTSNPMPTGKGLRASSQSHLAYFNASELPQSAWLVAEQDWCVVNNMSLITETKEIEGSMYFESPYFREFLEIPGLELMGNVEVTLECGEVLHIEDALYIESAKCNLFSVRSLKSQKQNPMSSDSDYCLRTHKDHLYLFDESDGERIRITRKVANRTVLLTRDPSIQEITDYAVRHKIQDNNKVWIKEL